MKTNFKLFIILFFILVSFMGNVEAENVAKQCGFLDVTANDNRGKLNVTFKNKSKSAMYIPVWFVGEVNSLITHDMFIVRNLFGFRLGYKGPLIKRAEPTLIDMVKINPESEAHFLVDLKHGYVKNNGTYTVRYNSFVKYYIEENNNLTRCFEEVFSNKAKINIK